MNKEIGGYFELENGINSEYYDFLRFNSSRNSLQFVIRERKIKKIYIPIYLCLVIEETLRNEKVEIEYYHIKENFLPEILNYDNSSYIYIVNYFGLISERNIKKIAEKYNNKIILDNTHSFFMKPFLDIDIIYNCRKYFGVPDGSYLYTNLRINNEYKKASSMERISHIFGRYEDNASNYYKFYIAAEESLNNRNIEIMSRITQNMLKNIEYRKIEIIRKNNFKYLNNKLKTVNLLNIKSDSSNDFMYPLLVEKGNKVRKRLIKEKIYVPTLWPNLDNFTLNSFEKNLFENLVVLPIDQRYTIDDMEYVYKKVYSIMKETMNEKN